MTMNETARIRRAQKRIRRQQRRAERAGEVNSQLAETERVLSEALMVQPEDSRERRQRRSSN